jgi:oligosaccharide reducing-end xylanase
MRIGQLGVFVFLITLGACDGSSEQDPTGSAGNGANAGNAGGGQANATLGGRAGTPTGGNQARGGGTGGGGTSGGGTSGPITQPTDPCAPRAGYRNLFAEVLKKTDAEVIEKLDDAFQSLFHGGDNAKIYYEVGTDEAYILDVNNNDVRSEGMSYGMTIAVQLDKKTEFDRLWKWARNRTRQQSGYFAWQASPSGQILSMGVAPDGDEYFATALILASKRWGDGTGIFAYSTEAKSVLDALANRGAFNRDSHIVAFGPNLNYGDPSYVLPAFYEYWACFDDKTRDFWKASVTAGRQYFHKATHDKTGLAPYLSNFDGSPYSGGPDFNSDSWRVVGNIMMDYHLFGADSWQATFAQKYAAFFAVEQAKRPAGAEFKLDGTVTVSHDSPAKGLVAQNAMVGFAVPPADSQQFLQDMWNLSPPTGQYRYYDGVLYLLAYLHLSGQFRLY